MDEQARAGATSAVPVGPTARRWLCRILVMAGLGVLAWLLGGTTASYADSGPLAAGPAGPAGPAGAHADLRVRGERSGPLPSLVALPGAPAAPIPSPGPTTCPPRPIVVLSVGRGHVCPLSRINGTATDVLSLAAAPARQAVRALPAPSSALGRLAAVTARVDDPLDVPIGHSTTLGGLLTGPRPATGVSAGAAGGMARPTDSGERPSAVPLSGRPATGTAVPVRSVRSRPVGDGAPVVGGTPRARVDRSAPAAAPSTLPGGPRPAPPTVPAMPAVPAPSGTAAPTGAGFAPAAMPVDGPLAPDLQQVRGPCRQQTSALRQPADDPSVSPD